MLMTLDPLGLNKTRPLVKLAKAAERFGKGDYVNDFRPSGAK